MKLGFLTEPSSNGYYRAVIPMRALEQRGHTILWQEPLGVDLPLKQLLGCDLVHCYRRMDRFDTLRALSERGVAVSFDNDDDFSAAEVGAAGERLDLAAHRKNRERFREVFRSARLADLTTTTTAPLAEQYRAAGAAEVAVIENRLERGMPGFGSRSRSPGVLVGWIAGREHGMDLERVPIVDAFQRLLAAHPELQLLTIGVKLPLRSDRYEHIAEIKYRDILKTLARIDIGVAPLADTRFNRSRSNVKLKEYASATAAWLASPVGPYLDMGERQGGLLVDDGGWYEAIDELLRNPRKRRRLAKRALRWAKQQTIDHHAEEWERAFESAIAHAAGRSSRAA